MNPLTQELIEKAKTVKTAEELLALAKENGIEMTKEEANDYYAQFNPKLGELDDDDLDNVSGGGCGGAETKTEEPTTATKFCTGCNQTVQITRRLDTEGDIDGYFGVCPNCGKPHFNL